MHLCLCSPRSVLRPVPRPGVGVELLDHGLLLVPRAGDDVGPGAGAGHGGAEEDVDDEHEEEEDAEDDAEVEQPRGPHAARRQAVAARRVGVAGLCGGKEANMG